MIASGAYTPPSAREGTPLSGKVQGLSITINFDKNNPSVIPAKAGI
jgi:hypothetical protein